MRCRFFTIPFVLLLLSVAQLPAQTLTTGQVTGTVTDPAGAVVASAPVTLKNNDTGATTATKTNATGAYSFPLLAPGTYTITVNAAGFSSSSRAVSVSLGAVATANIQVSLKSATETIEVTEQAATVDTESANVTTNFNSKQIALLPNPGNDLSAVALTAPGITMNSTGGSTFGGGNFSAYGLPSVSNLFTYDGANDNDPFFNINNTGAVNLSLGLNDVEETAVVNNGYSGQYGGLAGANVNYVSKSGSNQFHGNAEYWWNGDVLNANNYFQNQNGQPSPFVNANQYAASFGGPIKKDKAFFFVDYEGIRLVIPSPRSVNLPSQNFEQAVLQNLTNTGFASSVPFYQQMFNLYNSTPGYASAQNTVDQTGGCSNVTSLAGFAGFGAANPCALQLNSAPTAHTNDWLIVGRADVNLTNNDKLFVRVQHEQGNQASFTDPVSPAFNAVSNQPEWQSQLSETHTFGSDKVNNFVASLQWYSAMFTLANPAQAATFPAQFQLGDNSLSALNTLGSIFPQGRNVTQYGITDDFSWTHGRHTFKTGVNFRRDDVSDHNFTGFVPTVSPNSLADFAMGGGADSLTQNFPTVSNVPIALYQLGAYFGDDIRVTNSFKLTLNLRLDHLSNPVCQIDCFQRLTAPFFQLDHTGPVNQAILTNQHNAFPSVSSVVAQPRIGFTWSPRGSQNLVIRGGAGIFSDAIPTGAIDSFLGAAPLDPQFTVVNAPVSPDAANNLYAQAAANNLQFQQNFASGGPVPAFNFYNATQVNVPRYYEWSLEMQDSIGRNTIVSLKYVGNHGSWEEFSDTAKNAFSSIPFATLPTSAPDPRFATVSEQANIANSNYSGFVASVQHHFTGGFQFQASYTWSHALDEISNNSLSPFGVNTFGQNVDVVNPQDPYNPFRYNRGNADYDVRHNFTMNYVWTDALRHLTSAGPNAVMKGWTFAGTIIAHSGFPYTVFTSNDTLALLGAGFPAGNYGTGVQSVFANVVGSPNLNCGSSAAQLNNPCLNSANFSIPFDPATYTGTPVAQFGQQSRNQFRGPGYFDTDFSVEKAFGIPHHENMNFSVGARFFNLFNHPNFAFPIANTDSAQFGQILSTVNSPTSIYGSGLGADSSPRLVQLQAKFTF